MMAREDRRRATIDWFVTHPSFHIRPWSDPVIDQLGYDVRHLYVETYWLPIIGPSAVFAARRLADWLDSNPTGVRIELVEFGASLGVGAGTGRNTQINRTLCRLIDFGMARIAGDDLEGHTIWPPVPLRLQQRLPPSLANALSDHDRRMRSVT